MVTHWSVNDQVAAFLVADTLRRMRENPSLGVAGALRDAQLAMLADAGKGLPAEIAHPFFWAPFAVIGEGGERVGVAAEQPRFAAARRRSISAASHGGTAEWRRSRPSASTRSSVPLGRGAMGTVYEGWDPIIARRVAIKTVRLPDSRRSAKPRRRWPASAARRRRPDG